MEADYLALCPICHRKVGLVSRRVAANLRCAATKAKLRTHHAEDYDHGQRQDCDAASVLAKWAKVGLVIERVDGDAPELEGHAPHCQFGRKTVRMKKSILPLNLPLDQYRAKWESIRDRRTEKERERRKEAE